VSRLAPLLLALVLAGCGASNDSAGDFEGAERDVARTIEDLEEAAQEDEPRRICQGLLAREVVATITATGDCDQVIQKALDQADTFSLTVESVRVTGETARARVETGLDEEQTEIVELRLEDRAWKISGLPGLR
jgi:hypothetical protein